MSEPEVRLEDVDFFDPEIRDCPYGAYQTLRDEAPVWIDPTTGFYVVTRYDDVRQILLDTDRFRSGNRPRGANEAAKQRALKVYARYQEKGWVPAPTLAGRDDPNHREMRRLFDHAFRPSRIKQLDPFVEALAHRLIDGFIGEGRADWVKQFAVPLPLIVIGRQMGAPEEDIWRIKAWTDAWVQRLGMMQTEEEALWSTDMEIEAQHYFQKIFERLRRKPDESLLSALVNTVIPQWGRTLTDNELHAEMMQDTFVGGSETTTNAMSAGIMLLAQNPGAWRQLKAEPERYLRTFCEEVVRLESPVQGLTRTATVDVELAGVHIPKGAVLDVRFAAGNRDGRHFTDPDSINLQRRNAASHLGFSSGTHYCLGAPLARRELYWGFKAFIDAIDDFELAPGRNDLRHHPNYSLRALQELHIEFIARS